MLDYKPNQLILIMFAIALGAYLRLYNLGLPPLWCDEAILATRIHDFEINQEQIPAILSYLVGVNDEFHTRLPYAITGILTIAAIYFIRPSKWSLLASIFVAVFPLFVFYSRMARPYVMAGLCVVLGWRWVYWNIPVVFITPTALSGIDLIKLWKNKIFYIILAALALGLLLVRRDISDPKFFTWDMFKGGPRFWYVPALAIILYLVYYVLPWLEKKIKIFPIYVLCVIFGCIFGINESLKIIEFKTGPPLKPWYSHLIYYNDWKGCPQVDFATNFIEITKFYTGKEAVLLRVENKRQIDSIMATKDTILVGADCYANHLSAWFFPEKVIAPYRNALFNGGVMVFRLTRVNKTDFKSEVVYKSWDKH